MLIVELAMLWRYMLPQKDGCFYSIYYTFRVVSFHRNPLVNLPRNWWSACAGIGWSGSSESPVEAVYNQITADLLAAQDLLSSDPAPINKARVNQYAVKAFLARVYLYQKQWSAAESAATSVINANYKLEPILSKVFLAGDQEQIWQMPPLSTGNETTEGQTFLPAAAGVKPQFGLTNTQIAVFEPGDQRKTQWLNSVTLQGTVYVYPFKYKLGYQTT